MATNYADGAVQVQWDSQLQHYEATSADFPGCIGVSKSDAHEAIRNLRQSVADYLTLEEQGYRDPARSLHELVSHQRHQ